MAIVCFSRTWSFSFSVTVAAGRACVEKNPTLALPSLTSRFTAASMFAAFTPSMSRKGYQYCIQVRVSYGCSQL